MSITSQPLIELLRNTPPPSITGRQESVRSIPPPPLCPPPLTILKMVPPPPLPSHLSRIGAPSAGQMNTNHVMGSNNYTSTLQQRNVRSAAEANYQDTMRVQGKKGPSKPTRLAHCGTRDNRSRDTTDRLSSRSRDTIEGAACRSRDALSGVQSRSRDAMDGVSSRSRDIKDLQAVRSHDCELIGDTVEDAELVNVLKHLVNLFTMTSQVKAALSRVRPKADDTGIQHQVSRTRALVETFREQLARRTVTLGRLIPPDTTGKPEIPRELRTKDPAGGDVSPQPDVAAGVGSPPTLLAGQEESPGGGGVTTQAAISSLQALVYGDAETSAVGASRWSSRVKRRFLAASRPARRIMEKLKAPHCSSRWQGCPASTPAETAPAPAVPSSSSPASSPASCCSSEDGNRPGHYFSPGCYVIDGAGRPVSVGADTTMAAKETTTTTKETETGRGKEKRTADAASAAAAVFGIPLSVLMAEAAKKKRKEQTTTACGDSTENSPRTAAAAAAGAAGAAGVAGAAEAADQGRRDRSWMTTSGAAGTLQTELRDTLEGLCRLRVAEDPPTAPAPAAAVEGSTKESSPRDHPVHGEGQEVDEAVLKSQDDDDKDNGEEEEDEKEEDVEENGEEEDWMTSSFDEDWFLSTEKEEEEQRRTEEAERRRRQEECTSREEEEEQKEQNEARRRQPEDDATKRRDR